MPRKFYQSLKYASGGINHALKTQRNIRIHIVVAIAVALFGVYIKLSSFELVAVILSICFVLVSEMVNTAIEEMVNLLSPSHSRSAMIAKDVAAGPCFFPRSVL